MPPSPTPVIVAGAGIGGLAAALALQRQGVPVSVHDRSPDLEPLGAGLSLWPNAVLALEALGAGAALRTGAIPHGGAGLHRWDGAPLATDDPAAIEHRYGAPLVLLHRAELQHALLDALEPGTVRLGETIESYAQDDDGVAVAFASGAEARGALLVGADGLRSTVREQLLGDGPPRSSGLVAFRGVVAAEAPEHAGEFWGDGGVFGIAPLSGGRVYWYATQREGDTRSLREAFAGWTAPIPELIERTPEADVLRHPLHDRPPATGWTDGRVGLLGDAAHPMLPFLGQGACQALEDAVALGAAVAEHGTTPAALDAYAAARRARAEMLVKRSRSAGRLAHLRPGWQRRLRDALVRRAPAGARERQLDAALGLPA